MHVTFGLKENSVDISSSFVLPFKSSPTSNSVKSGLIRVKMFRSGSICVKLFGSGLVHVIMFGSGLIRVKTFNSGALIFLLTKPYLSNNMIRLLHTHPGGPGGPGGPVGP